MKFPGPALITEVLSPSTEENDRGIKFKDYALHGVSEYWIVDPEEQFIEQYILNDDTYKLKMKSSTGILKSPVLTGFEIPVESIFNKEKNLEVLTNFLKKQSAISSQLKPEN